MKTLVTFAVFCPECANQLAEVSLGAIGMLQSMSLICTECSKPVTWKTEKLNIEALKNIPRGQKRLVD